MLFILPTLLLSLLTLAPVLAQPASSIPGDATPSGIFTTSTLPTTVYDPRDVKLAIAAIVLSSITIFSLVAGTIILFYRCFRRRKNNVAEDGTNSGTDDLEQGTRCSDSDLDQSRSSVGQAWSCDTEQGHSSLETGLLFSQPSSETYYEKDGKISLEEYSQFTNVVEILDHFLPLNRSEPRSNESATGDYQPFAGAHEMIDRDNERDRDSDGQEQVDHTFKEVDLA
jgi:hypothetical protein